MYSEQRKEWSVNVTTFSNILASNLDESMEQRLLILGFAWQFSSFNTFVPLVLIGLSSFGYLFSELSVYMRDFISI